MHKVAEAHLGEGKIGQKHVEDDVANWIEISIADAEGWIRSLATIHSGQRDGVLRIDVGPHGGVPPHGWASGPARRVVRGCDWQAGDGRCRRGEMDAPRHREAATASALTTALKCLGHVRAMTWNIAHLSGAWHSDPTVLGRKRRKLESMAGSHDAFALQETRGAADMHTLPDSHQFWGTFDAHRDAAVATARGGTILGIARKWTDEAISIRQEVLQAARAIGITIELPDAKLAFASVHVDPAMNTTGKTRLFRAVRRWLDGCTDCLALLLGGWNCMPSDEARLSGLGSETASSDRCLMTLPRSTSPTTQGAEEAPTACRSARAYARVDQLDAPLALWTAGTVGSLSARARPSDHLVVSVSIRPRKARSSSRPPLPPHLFQLPEVWRLFGEYARTT